jgi:hypothetical protein
MPGIPATRDLDKTRLYEIVFAGRFGMDQHDNSSEEISSKQAKSKLQNTTTALHMFAVALQIKIARGPTHSKAKIYWEEIQRAHNKLKAFSKKQKICAKPLPILGKFIWSLKREVRFVGLK